MNQYTKYMTLKSAMENLFGAEAWYALKESNYLPTWKKYGEKLLKAVELSIKDTVEICDNEWINQIEKAIKKGLKGIKSAKEIDEILGELAGTLINISFMQIGHMPTRSGVQRKFALRKGKWKFNTYRSVVYLQTQEQKENQYVHNQKIKIGFEKQQGLFGEYYRSKSKLPYYEWCKEREKA